MAIAKNKSSILRFSRNDVTIHQHKTCYQGFFKMDVYQVSHPLYQGGQSDILSREIFERGDAVVMIPYDAINDRVVLIEQFRPGALKHHDSPWLLEFVAGMFAENETPIDVAIREAQEEANLIIDPKNTLKVMEYLSSPGGMSEVIHLYVGQVDSNHVGGVHGLPEEGEDILVHVMAREQAFELLQHGKITNAATIIGLQWLQLNYQRLQETWQ